MCTRETARESERERACVQVVLGIRHSGDGCGVSGRVHKRICMYALYMYVIHMNIYG